MMPVGEADGIDDFKINYPWYFEYRELADPDQTFERPPVTSSRDRPDRIRASATPAPAPSLPRAMARPRAPPLPAPSDRSSTPPSPSPSPSLSPSPPHVASLSQMSLTPRPNRDPQKPSSTSVVPSGPRPHFRPNAVASSSQIPIKFESSSSASPASDTHKPGELGSDFAAGTESEHEMENDTIDTKSWVDFHPLPDRVAASHNAGKRSRPAEPFVDTLVKRPRAKCGQSPPQDEPSSPCRDGLGGLETPLDEPSGMDTPGEGHQDQSKSRGGFASSTLLRWGSLDQDTLDQARDRFMRQIHDAVGPFSSDHSSHIPTPLVFEHAPEIVDRYNAALTASNRQKVDITMRRKLLMESLTALHKHQWVSLLMPNSADIVGSCHHAWLASVFCSIN